MSPSPGYAFEKVVVEELKALGYPVFYQNLKMRMNGMTFVEFDIISLDFILEVKSGKSLRTCGLDMLYAQRKLPENFVVYIYCKVKTNEEIAEQNSSGLRNIVYINNLQEIVKAHPPRNICNIKTEKNLNRFLRTPFELMKRFDMIYVLKDTFNHTHHSLNYIKDWYSKIDGTKRSDKLRHLVDMGKIVFVDTFDANIPEFDRYYLGSSNHNLKTLHRITIPLIYKYNLYSQYHEDCIDIAPPFLGLGLGLDVDVDDSL